MLVGAWPTPKWHILYILYIYDMWVNLAPQRAEKMAVEWECGTGIRPSFTEIFWYLKSSFSIWVLLAYVFNHDLTKHYWANFWVLNFLKIWYFLQREDGMGLNYHPSNTNSIDLDSTSQSSNSRVNLMNEFGLWFKITWKIQPPMAQLSTLPLGQRSTAGDVKMASALSLSPLLHSMYADEEARKLAFFTHLRTD